jgi:hypothetical protein
MANFCRFNFINSNYILSCNSRKAVPRYVKFFKRSIVAESTQGFQDRVHLSAERECNIVELRSVEKLISGNLLVYNDFITEEEEMILYDEVKPSLEKRSYQHEHWDDVSITAEFQLD